MNKIIILFLVILTMVLSIWQWDKDIDISTPKIDVTNTPIREVDATNEPTNTITPTATTKPEPIISKEYEYLLSLWPVQDVPLEVLGIMETVELRSYDNRKKPSTITYSLFSKDVAGHMVERYEEFLAGEWKKYNEHESFIMEDGIIQGDIPVTCIIDEYGKYKNTVFELQISKVDEYIDKIYKEKSLGKILVLHELLVDDSSLNRSLTYHTLGLINISYKYELRKNKAREVLLYYENYLKDADDIFITHDENEEIQSLEVKIEDVDIRITRLDGDVIEIWYGFVE